MNRDPETGHILRQTEPVRDSLHILMFVPLPKPKSNLGIVLLGNKDERFLEMTSLGAQDTHLLWAHLMSAVDKMSTNQGESNGITQHGGLLQGHRKHLLKGTEMEAAEKEEGDLKLRFRSCFL